MIVMICSVTFELSLQDWRRGIPSQVPIRVLHGPLLLLSRRGPLTGSPRPASRGILSALPTELSVLRLQLLDLVAHLHDDLRQAAGALHGGAAALPEPGLPKYRRRVVHEQVPAVLLLLRF